MTDPKPLLSTSKESTLENDPASMQPTDIHPTGPSIGGSQNNGQSHPGSLPLADLANNTNGSVGDIALAGQPIVRIPLDTLFKLDERYQALDRIGWWILTGVVGLFSSIAWLFTGFVIREQFDSVQWIGLIGVAAFTGLCWLGSRFFPKRTYETTRWQLKSNGIEIRKGIWWQHRIFIPHDRIQHTDVNQGPIARMYGLATLVINTGGTHEPSIPLEGLSLETAERLRTVLSASSTSVSTT
ncbi:MAG: PH domain-containing protein [Pirellula sp.]